MLLQVKRVFPKRTLVLTGVRFPSCSPNVETEDRNMDEDTEDKCPSNFNCGNAAKELHTCPYAEEINDDSEALCICCDDCTQECAWDI